ncbi:hypothetical protein F4821DRAFT_252097 [Hypoxylon rubiginosum]|uniref:Uncharacterized protein n=1 Tax=Hypoxylon rubiginosum TaxID=110542 RepID=A0ACC0CIC6_9PEZI|nr:hypothetical protein F4821DRAFT_252097 [Hypoxylon rubiginosum]
MDRNFIHIQPGPPEQARTQAAFSPEHPSLLNTRASGRRKARQACYACRERKTKCTGAPCKRCQSYGLVCEDNAKKTRQSMSERDIKTLEESQSALCETVRKLYAMVRNGDKWTAAEPELEDEKPVILDIVSKLRCMHPREGRISPSDRFLPKEQSVSAAQQAGVETESMPWVGPESHGTQSESYSGHGLDPFGWYGQVDTGIRNYGEDWGSKRLPSQYPFCYYNPTTTSYDQSTTGCFTQSGIAPPTCTLE